MNEKETRLIKDNCERIEEIAKKLLDLSTALKTLDDYDGGREDALNQMKDLYNYVSADEFLDADDLAAVITGEGLPEPVVLPPDEFERSLLDKIFGPAG